MTTAIERAWSLPGITRVWPDKGGAVTCERRDDRGHLRALRIDSDANISALPYAYDPALPTLRPLPFELVVHRFGRRAVHIGGGIVRKHVRRGRIADLVDRHDVLQPAADAAGIALAGIISVGPCTIDFEQCAGDDLSDTHGAHTAWEAFANKWPVFALQPTQLPSHSGEHEALTLSHWVFHALTHGLLRKDATIQRLSDAICHELMNDPDPLVTSHRDLHEQQLLWDGTRLTLIDLDTAARAEAALDIGNLIAHTRLSHIRGTLDATTMAERLRLCDEAIGRLPISPRRLAVYTASACLRLVCVHSFRPASLQWMPTWIDYVLNILSFPSYLQGGLES